MRARTSRTIATRFFVSLATALLVVASATPPASAENFVPISGAGSTWSKNAIDTWIRNVFSNYGMQVNYNPTGSSDGRNQFKNGTVDFAVSEIPYGITDGGVTDVPPSRGYAYMPIVAGGTSFMYNLKIGAERVRNLRLSGANVAKIFTGVITSWDDPAIKADNPALALPARKIVPVVRSDGSGTTAQFTRWMSSQHQAIWDDYCRRAGRATPCKTTSNYPTIPASGFVAKAGSDGVSGFVQQANAEGSITYVEYSFPLKANFPVAKVLNGAGYYVAPTAQNVAVALTKAEINPSDLTQNLDRVYTEAADKRNYPLSSYSYMILPTKVEGTFSPDKGRTLGRFAYYFLCEGQQQVHVTGYSPLPINLVQAGFEQVKRIPGVDVQGINIAGCNNPTFSTDGTNTLAMNAPQPPECDKQGGPTQCTAEGAPAAPASGSNNNAGANSNAGGGPSGDPNSSAADPSATASGAAAPGVDPAAAIDPDTGEPLSGGGLGTEGPSTVAGVPVQLAAGSGGGLDTTLVVMAVALAIGITVGPPLIARALALRRRP